MHKRLIALLLVFVFLGGIAAGSAFIFRVQEINVAFVHDEHVIIRQAEVGEVKHGLVQAVSGVAQGRNILIGLNRRRIINAVESHDSRVRLDIGNIEARFPNRLYVTVRERFPMYYVAYGARYAVLDYTLQKVATDRDLVREFDLIRLNEQFSFTNFNAFFHDDSIGKNLREFVESYQCLNRIQILIYMSHLFFGQGIREDDLCHLVEKIDFTDKGKGSMEITLRDDWGWGTSIEIEIRNYTQNFRDKLARAWWVLDNVTQQQEGNIIAECGDYEITILWISGGVS